ncbi:DUF5829 family protein [Streptomyces sp. KR55]|uniref:DUF5829 family protein n=1 Tax=Streptomyces sp. KR55 TaxID=3457425 RepID=UPI003FD64E11
MTSGSAGGGQGPVPRIDHIMVLLDEEAHQDVSRSDFIGERFGRIKRKEADSSVAGAYSTFGVAGEHTLIELFGTALPSTSPLTGGLVFSFEEPGSSAAARAQLDASGRAKYHYDLVRRTVDGSDEQQPWYHLISVDLGEASPLLLFLNEVTDEYFRSIGARPAPDGTRRRRDYLDAALGTPYDGTRMMRDITGVRLSVGTERAQRIADALAVFGYRAAEREGGSRELRGPGLDIRLDVDDAAGERVTEIEIGLVSQGPPGPEIYTPAEFRFGSSSRLVIETPGRARWLFEPMDR